MGLNWGAGATGAAQGFATGGYWGAAIGGIMGLFSSDENPQEDALKAQENFYNQQAQIAQQQWNVWQNNVLPLVQQYSQELQKGPDAEKYATKAASDVMQSWNTVRGASMRNLRSIGGDPSGGAAMNQLSKDALQVTALRSGAANMARDKAEQNWRQNVSDFTKSQPTGAETYANAGVGAYRTGQSPNPEQAAMTQLTKDFSSPAAQERFKHLGSDVFGWGKGGGSVSGMYPQGEVAGQPVYDFTADGGMPGCADGGNPYDNMTQPSQSAAGDSGAVTGPGGPVDDEIPADMPKGSYVIPADVVEKLGVQFFDKLEMQCGGSAGVEGAQGRANAMLSDGEYVVSPECVRQKGKKFFDDLIAKYHKPAAEQREEYQEKNQGAQPGEGRMQFAGQQAPMPASPPQDATMNPQMVQGFGRADGGYNEMYETELGPKQESSYQQWKAQHRAWDSGRDYDLRGAWSAGRGKSGEAHMTDKYKKPSHPTFSDESQYANTRGAKPGSWAGDKYVPHKADGGEVSGKTQAAYMAYCTAQQEQGLPCMPYAQWKNTGPGQPEGGAKADGGPVSPPKEIKQPDNAQPPRIKAEVDKIADKYKAKKADGGQVGKRETGPAIPKGESHVHKFANGGKVEKVMHEFKHGQLHSGSKHGPMVKDRDQAIAIAMSEAKKAGEGKKDGGKLGAGTRFAKVEAEAKASGARNPAAVAAAAGIKKYGKAKMEKMAQAGKRRKTRRGGKKHRAARLANGGIVRGSPEWYRMQGIRPQAGDKGPAPKPVEGQYGKDKEQPKSNVVSKFGAAGRKKAQRDANEGYPTGGR